MQYHSALYFASGGLLKSNKTFYTNYFLWLCKICYNFRDLACSSVVLFLLQAASSSPAASATKLTISSARYRKRSNLNFDFCTRATIHCWDLIWRVSVPVVLKVKRRKTFGWLLLCYWRVYACPVVCAFMLADFIAPPSAWNLFASP